MAIESFLNPEGEETTDAPQESLEERIAAELIAQSQ